ncbi:MAG: ABC transporter ATP-binding protein/permease, partial [Silvanigrellaceae bacterium]|nr:ABC transporter ATP-binding protein/permease [Silvanigrellaceae bacterium]
MNTEYLPKVLFSFIFFFLKKHLFKFIFIQICSLSMAIDPTLMPYFIGKIIDILTNFSGDKANIWSHLAYPTIAVILLWTYIEYSFRAAGILSAKFFPKVEAEIRIALLDYTLKHSYAYFSDRLAGDIANKISDTAKSFTNIVHLFVYLFIPVAVCCIVSFFFLFQIQPLFAFVLFIWVSVHFIVCFAFVKKCDYYSSAHAFSNSLLAGKIVDSISNFSNIKLFSAIKNEVKLIKKYQTIEQKKHSRSLIYIEKIRFMFGLNVFIGAGIVTNYLLIHFWQTGAITIGEIVTIYAINSSIIQLLWFVGTEFPNLFREMGVLRQGLSIIEDPHEIQDKQNAKELIVTKGQITFEKVNFSYSAEKSLFVNKTFYIEPGSKVGLVGFSGSGKTTLINLIMRFFKVNSGRILIDNQDISEVTQDSLRNSIALIPQDPSLFHRSLRENIQFGNTNARYDEVILAAKQAHAHDFIIQTKNGYQTKVGERGIKLSGGQKQRIAIA